MPHRPVQQGPRQMNLVPTSISKLPKTETPQAAHAFEEYYALGAERSLKSLAGKSGVNIRLLERWSSAHKWQDRVIERDRQEMLKKRRKREAEQEKMNEEHAAWGKGMAALAMKQCQDLIKAQSMNAQAAVLLFKYATDLQRLAMGDATDTMRLQLQDANGNPASTDALLLSGARDALLQKLAMMWKDEQEQNGTEGGHQP